MHTKKIYSNGQSRGGPPGVATVTLNPKGRNPRDYHRQMVNFHGGEQNLNAFTENGRKGYRV